MDELVKFPSRDKMLRREVADDALLTPEERLWRVSRLYRAVMMLRQANPRFDEIEAADWALREQNHQRLKEFMRNCAAEFPKT